MVTGRYLIPQPIQDEGPNVSLTGLYPSRQRTDLGTYLQKQSVLCGIERVYTIELKNKLQEYPGFKWSRILDWIRIMADGEDNSKCIVISD